MASKDDDWPVVDRRLPHHFAHYTAAVWLCSESGVIYDINLAGKERFPSFVATTQIQSCLVKHDIPAFEAYCKSLPSIDYSPVLRLLPEAGLPYAMRLQCNPFPLEAGPLAWIITAFPLTQAAYLADLLEKIAMDLAFVKEDTFFDALVSSIGTHLHKNQALIGGLSADGKSISASSLWYNGRILHGAAYDLAATPCEQVITEKVPKCFLRALQAKFPLDDDLVTWGSRSYVGVPLINDDGGIIGHLATLAEEELTEAEANLARDVLAAFAPRVAHQMMRTRGRMSFKSIFEHNPIGIVLGTPDNPNIEGANPAFAEMLGYTPAELKGKPIAAISHSDFSSLHEKVHASLAQRKGGGMKSFLKKYKHRDGSIVVGEITISKVKEYPGVPSFHIAMIRNVTDELATFQRLQQQEATQSAILENSPDAIVTVNADGTLKTFNRAFHQTYKQVYGLEVKAGDDLRDWPDWHFWEPKLERVWAGESFQMDSELRVKEYYAQLVNAFRPILGPKDEVIGAAAYFKDVTAVRQSERTRLQGLRRFDQIFNNSAIGWIEFDMSQPVAHMMALAEEGITDYEDYLLAHPERIPSFLGEFKDCNRRYLQMVGAKSKEEFANQRRDVYGADIVRFLAREIAHVLTDEVELEMEIPITGLDEVTRWLYLWINYPKDKDYSSVIYGALDITEQKRMESVIRETDLMIRKISETISDLLYIYDLEKKEIVFSNHSIATYLDYNGPFPPSRSSLLAQVHPDDIVRLQEPLIQLFAMAEDQAIEIELRTRNSEDTYRWNSVIFKVFKRNEAGEVVQLMGVARNIDQRKRIENSVREKNVELKRYIASNMQLENFAYIASHDLKEPLRTIGSFAQLLQRRYQEHLDAQGQSYLDFIHQGAQNLNLLIEDLLLYAQVADGARKVQIINMNQTLKQVVYHLGSKIEETQAMITYGNLPSHILANPTQIVQVFQNLIVNAIKFAREGVRPEVAIRGHRERDGWSITVQDNGIGIAPEFHETVFLLFKKLHTRDEYPGTGIGLALVKKIIEEHGGRISLDTDVSVGTVFHIWLPNRRNEDIG